MSLKEIRERHEKTIQEMYSIPNSSNYGYLVAHQDRAELLKLLDEAKTIIQRYYNRETFDDIKVKLFLNKLEK